MKLALTLYPVYDEHKKNAHTIAAKSWANKITGLLSGRQYLKLTVFFTGQMLEALGRDCKKEAKQLRRFVANKQLEFLGGAYNSAMLPLFPEKLRELQTQKHKELLSKLFMEPSGHFCPSHAWEIDLIESLEKSSFSYTLMPNTSVQEALGRKSAVSGWFAAEYGSSFMRILTYSQSLSQACQNLKRADIISAFKKHKDLPGITCALISVNLHEPQSHEWLQAIDTSGAEALDIEHCLLTDAITGQKAAGKVNLITYSTFAPSSRDVLLHMPEINCLHKRILSIYFRAKALNDSLTREKVFNALLDSMQHIYFKNTVNGMGLDAMRFYANRAVMKAEKVLLDFEEAEGIRFAMFNFLLDGNQQLAFSNQHLECLIEPAMGGWIRTLSHRPSFSELACSIRDDGEVSPLFLDHICPFEFETLDQRNSWINDRQGAFLNPYESAVKKQENKVQVVMQSEQGMSYAGREYSFKVEKVFGLKNDSAELLFSISITNSSFNAFHGEFATELCLGFRYDDIRGQSLKIQGEKIKTEVSNSFHVDVQNVDFRDRHLGIGANIEMSKNVDLLCAPILGIGSDAAPSIAQGLRLVIFRKAELKGQETETFHLRIHLNGGGFFF